MNRFFFIIAVAFSLLVSPAPVPSQDDPKGDCGPIALLEGDNVIDAISEILTERKVSTQPKEGCPATRAFIEARPKGLWIRITDPFGRTSERTVDDPTGAATLIESWVRGDIGLDLVQAPEIPATTPEPVQPTPTPVPQPTRPKGTIFISGEVFLGTDNSFWLGADLGGCGRVGPSCIGGLIRYTSNEINPSKYDRYDLDRYGADALVFVDFPLQAGTIFVTPGVGLGAGWLHTEGRAQNENDGTGRWERFDTYGPTGEIHIGFGHEVTSGMTLGLSGAFRFYYPPHIDDFRRGGRILPGEPWGFGGTMFMLMYRM